MTPLTYNDVADFYDRKTGQHARIQPMEKIVEWCLKQPEIAADEDDNICWKDGLQ